MEQGSLQMKRWESERSTRARASQQKGFKDHVATDGSLLGNDGKWGACGLGNGTAGKR